jgi:hypothetical protein
MKSTNYNFTLSGLFLVFLLLLQSAMAANTDKAILKGKVTDALTHLP